jgi:transcriptional regulator with XRE-family HTH domain
MQPTADNEAHKQEFKPMQDESETTLGNHIRHRRGELGLSLNHLAAATGLHKSFLSRLESGAVRQPATDSLRRIARALDVSETELYGLLDRRARDELPALQPYLRAKYDLPDAVIADISGYLSRYGGLSTGPRDGEDEEPEAHSH